MPRPKPVSMEEIKSVCRLKDKGYTYDLIGKKLYMTTKRVESVVSSARVKGLATQSFDFPQIIHAVRFGAGKNEK